MSRKAGVAGRKWAGAPPLLSTVPCLEIEILSIFRVRLSSRLFPKSRSLRNQYFINPLSIHINDLKPETGEIENVADLRDFIQQDH